MIGSPRRSRFGRLQSLAILLALIVAPSLGGQSRSSGPKAVGTGVKQRVNSLLSHRVVSQSSASIDVTEVGTGRVLASRNATSSIIPASNLKLFTTAAALDLLGSEFEFVTTVSRRGAIDVGGTLRGDVKVTGRGDPSIGSRFHDGNPTAVFEQWATELKRAGIKRIAGDLVFEHGYFDSEFVHPSWPKNQLTSWYEAPVGALSLQEGCVTVTVTPGAPGKPANVTLYPASGYFSIENTTQTRPGRGAIVGRKDDENTLVVRGNLKATENELQVFVAVVNPVRYFATVMRETLETNGIEVSGGIRLVSRDRSADWTVVSEYKTPLSVVVFVINKKSQNHYAEQLLKTLGAEIRGEGSFAAGTAVVEEWAQKKLGLKPDDLDMVDGSGMSRNNKASSAAFVALLNHVWERPYVREFLTSMPYMGESESRLRRRLSKPPYAHSIYAKTGYLSRVVGLSGYVKAVSGKVYSFSMIFNGYKSGVWEIYRLQDEILKEIVDGG